MDKRFLIAVVLAIGVVWLTPKIFPPPVAPVADSTAVSATTPAGDTTHAVVAPAAPVAPVAPVRAAGQASAAAAMPSETASVETPLATYRFSSAGASIIGASLHDYFVLPGRTRHVELARAGTPLLAYRAIKASGDTVDLAHVAFHIDSATAQHVNLRAAFAAGTMSVRYTFVADSYLVHVNGVLATADGARPRLALILPEGLASSEADTLDDQRHLAYVSKRAGEDAESAPFPNIVKKGPMAQTGPFDWIASKDKYVLIAVLAMPTAQLSGPAVFTAPATEAKVPSRASGEVVLTPDAKGRFAFEIYAGPQQWRRLVAVGRGLEHANPYGGFARGLIQPISTWVMGVLLWMHAQFKLNYGWVLIIFGIVVRIALWPLNQSAMRSSLRMQRIQPELQALQQKYKSNPEKMQEEYMKLLKAHDMTPFSQFTGCLPMLIPMPVLFAVFFVLQNTIEFRGVPFLWLADISLKDPYYILPLIMGVSMFVLSWVGLRNSPPNPQAKMMGYLMPGMMVALFVSFPAGLNLYYAVQNLAALPQQWMIARGRAKGTASPAVVPARK